MNRLIRKKHERIQDAVRRTDDVKEGGYMHENGEFERKTALEITLSGADAALADKVAGDLCRAFHQDTVLITEGLARQYCVIENA